MAKPVTIEQAAQQLLDSVKKLSPAEKQELREQLERPRKS